MDRNLWSGGYPSKKDFTVFTDISSICYNIINLELKVKVDINSSHPVKIEGNGPIRKLFVGTNSNMEDNN